MATTPAGSGPTGSTAYRLDVTLLFEQFKAELRDELLAELRLEAGGSAWPGWLSVETAARYLDIPVGRLRKLVARRQIPFAQEGVGCRLSFARRDLDSWMHSFQNDPAARGPARSESSTAS